MDTDLLHKYLSGICTEAEKKDVEHWLKDSSENKKKMSEIKKIWEVSPGKRIQVNSYEAWDAFKERHLNKGKKSGNLAFGSIPGIKNRFKYGAERKRSGRVIAYAVAAAAVLLITFIFYNSSSFSAEISRTELVSQEITTEKGQRTKVRLSDGTFIHLNAESKLRVPQDYMKNHRVVHLNGEAFFEVTSDKGRPFIVHTDKSITRVLGTKFNVTAYPNEGVVQVVVAEGKVALGSGDDLQAPEVQLTKNQKGTINDKGEIIASKVSDVYRYIDWSRGMLTFRDASLEFIERKLERWYDVEVEFDNSISKENRRLTGSFKDISMSSVLSSVALALELNYIEDGRKITFIAR